MALINTPITDRRTHIFPEDVGTGINGHVMIIDAKNSNSPRADSIRIFIPGGGQSSFSYQQAHLYTDVKLARVIPGSEIGLGVTAATVAMSKLLGKRMNPGVDILFQSTALRVFQFNFLMIPKNANESKQMKNIADSLRYHAAPEIVNLDLMFNVPSEFNIRFFYTNSRGELVENTNIPKIAKCVLERVDVDYAGVNGEWSTFADGSPVSCMITTQFKEMEVIDKKRIMDEGY